jgi:uncharacterized protein (TIGR03083 family)
MATSPWPVIHVERGALANDLSGLTDAQWQTPSLCQGWSVHDLTAHIVATAEMTKLGFFGKFAGSGFNFAKFADREVAEGTKSGPAATLAALRAAQNRTTSPPGPVDSWLGETLIHSEDIRRPLGLTHIYPMDAVIRTLDFYKKSNLIVGAKKRIAGLTLRATDADWSTGSGPEVSGPAMSLLLAMTGRAVALEDLTGDGVKTLRSRM